MRGLLRRRALLGVLVAVLALVALGLFGAPDARAQAPFKVTNLTATVADRDTITLSWVPPTSGVAHYNVQWKVIGTNNYDSNARQRRVDHSAGSVSTTFNLQNGSTYQFRVEACTGGNLCSNWVETGNVLLAVVPGKASVRVATLAGDLFVLRFTPPLLEGFTLDNLQDGEPNIVDDGGSAITSYKVRHREGTSSSWTDEETTTVDATDPGVNFNVSGISTRTSLTQVQTRAVNAVGEGPWSEIFIFGGSPQAPGNFTATPQTGGAGVNLSWDAPDAAGVFITNYRIEWRTPVDASANWTDSPADGSKNVVGSATGDSITSADGLAPGTAYAFRIRVSNGIFLETDGVMVPAHHRQSFYTPSAGQVAATTANVPAAPTYDERQYLTALWVRVILNKVDGAVAYQMQLVEEGASFPADNAIATSGSGQNTWFQTSLADTTEKPIFGEFDFLTPDTNYQTRARACASADGTLCSAWSEAATFFTLSAIDYDNDNDGLIEITTVAQLNAVRYDLDGNGVVDELANLNDHGRVNHPSAPFDSIAGCPGYDPADRQCIGYELTADLDLSTDYGSGEGWDPIGVFGDEFAAIFEGNGHTISNLLLDRSTGDEQGLFGSIGADGVVRNFGLPNVYLSALNNVGAVAGYSEGRITSVYATGSVRGAGSMSDNIGGLVGYLVGDLEASYFSGEVSGGTDIGGLVGFVQASDVSETPSIANSYAAANVSGADSVGGLIGEIERSTGAGQVTVSYSYAAGTVLGTGTGLGGLVGAASGSVSYSNSYFDTDLTEQTHTTRGKTSSALQTPTSDTGIYANWAPAVWDFGTNSQYPALKADFDGDTTATWQEFGYQVRVPIVMTAMETGARTTLDWNDVDAADRRGGTFTFELYRDDAVHGQPNSASTRDVHTGGPAYSYRAVIEIDGVAARSSNPVEVGKGLDSDGDGLLDIWSLEQLNAVRYDLDGNGAPSSGNEGSYRTAFNLPADAATACPSGTTCTGYELATDLDFNRDADYVNSGLKALYASTEGAGWDPIGAEYAATFDGNLYTISNLFIARPTIDIVGLFKQVTSAGVIRNVGLESVNVTGRNDTGALVGLLNGKVLYSYVTGTVNGRNETGGLVGRGYGTDARIAGSYSNAAVNGQSQVGGLVGKIQAGADVVASYAIGDVTGADFDEGRAINIGGLVGRMDTAGTSLSYSYARGAVVSEDTADSVAGLVGWLEGGGITEAYCDYELQNVMGDNCVRNNTNENNNAKKTTSELISPTDATGIYANWDDIDVDDDSNTAVEDPWVFGTATQYPALQADGHDSGTAASVAEFGTQMVDGVAVSVTATDPDPLMEGNLNGATITVDLIGAEFVTQLDTSDFALANISGASVSDVTRNSATQVTITVAYDGTDFDADPTLTVSVAASATDYTAALTATVDVTAVIESAAISATNPATLDEENADGATLTVDLTHAEFAATLHVTGFTVTGIGGFSVRGVSRSSDTRATVTLAYDDTDFDTDGTLTLAIGATQTTEANVLTATVSVDAVAESRPAGPNNLQGTAVSGTQIDLTWDAPATSNAYRIDYYEVQHRLASDPDWSNSDAAGNRVNTGSTATSYSITGLQVGTAYHLRVRACDVKAGNQCSFFHTAASSVSTLDIAATISSTNPPSLREENLNGAALTVDLVTVEWTQSLNASAFTISGVPGVSISGVNRVSDTRATITVAYDGTDFDADATLTLTVPASQTTHNAELTDTVMVTATDEPQPRAPTNLQGQAVSGSRIDLTWDAPTQDADGVDYYQVQTKPADQPNWDVAPVRAGSGTGYSVTGLTHSTAYDFRVYACDVKGSTMCSGPYPASGGVEISTLDLGPVIAATEPATLSETNLVDGAALIVELINLEWAETLSPSDFTVTAPEGITVTAVERVDSDEATVTIAYDNTDFDSEDFEGDPALALEVSAEAMGHSEPLTATTPVTPVDEPPPPQVTGVSATAGPQQLTITWNPEPEAMWYRIEWKAAGEGYSWERQGTIGASQTSFTTPGHDRFGATVHGRLRPDTDYTVRVAAVKRRAPLGQWSDEETAHTPAIRLSMSFNRSPLTSSNAHGAVLTLDLEGAEWIGSTGNLRQLIELDGFRFWKGNSVSYALSVSGIERVSDSRLRLTLRRGGRLFGGLFGGGSDIDGELRLTLTADNRTHTWSGRIRTDEFALNGRVEQTPGQVTGVGVSAARNADPLGAPPFLVVSWDRAEHATGYKVQYRTQGQSFHSSRERFVRGGSTTSYTLSGLQPRTEYWVRVIATTANASPEDGPPSHGADGGVKARTLVTELTLAEDGPTGVNPLRVCEAGNPTVTARIVFDGQVPVNRNAQFRAVPFGTAQAGVHYTGFTTHLPGARVTFSAEDDGQGNGVAEIRVPIRILDNSLAGGDKWVTLEFAVDHPDEPNLPDAAYPILYARLVIVDDESGDCPEAEPAQPEPQAAAAMQMFAQSASVTVSGNSLSLEEGGSASYTVFLDAQPSSNVVVELSSDNADVTTQPASLIFTPNNWQTPRTVAVSAVQDDDAVADIAVVSHRVSGDAEYDGIAVASVAVSVTDDDTAGVTISETDLSMAEGGSATYTVVLGAQPLSEVVMTVLVFGDVTAEPSRLTFTADNWRTPQTVTVSAAQDDDAEDEEAFVTHGIATAVDSGYANVAVVGIIVAVTDDDTAAQPAQAEPTPLDAPAPAGSAGDGRIGLTWAPVPNADSYTVAWSGGGDTGSATTAETRYTITGLTNGQEYSVTVTANPADGSTEYASSASDPITVTPVAPVSFGGAELGEYAWQQNVAVHLYLPAATGGTGPLTYSVSPELPDGLVFDPNALTITGKRAATQERAYYAYLAGDDAGDLAFLSFSIEVLPDPVEDRPELIAFYRATGGAGWTDNANWLSDRPLGEWHGVTTDDEGRVTHLALRENNLSGALSAELGGLERLQVLSLDRNGLSGSLPAELGDLSNLTRLALNRNSLEGPIPTELGNLSNLSIIGLARNNLTGGLPTGWGDISGLTRLSLHDNTELTGPLPDGFATNVDNLERLAVDNTGLCAPDTETFRTWLETVDDLTPDPVPTCEQG